MKRTRKARQENSIWRKNLDIASVFLILKKRVIYTKQSFAHRVKTCVSSKSNSCAPAVLSSQENSPGRPFESEKFGFRNYGNTSLDLIFWELIVKALRLVEIFLFLLFILKDSKA